MGERSGGFLKELPYPQPLRDQEEMGIELGGGCSLDPEGHRTEEPSFAPLKGVRWPLACITAREDGG